MTELEKRFYKIAEKLWADHWLLAAIGSRKDTQEDEEVLEYIDLRLEDKLGEHIEVIASVCTTDLDATPKLYPTFSS